MRLTDAFHATAARLDTKIAADVVGKASISFSELDARSSDLAHALVADGIHPGDRIGILSGHELDALVLFWAILKSSAVVVWLNDQTDTNGLRELIDSAEPARIFCDSEKNFSKIRDCGVPETQIKRLSELEQYATDQSKHTAELPTGNDTDLAAIVYTSGSTGFPKGVCLTHRGLLTVVNSVIEHMPTTSDDSYLMVVPLHYVHGLMQLLVHMVAGATIRFSGGFAFPRKIVELLRETEVTGFSGVPFHFNALIDKGGLLDAALPALTWMTVTGGKLPAFRIEQIVNAMPNIAFHIAYGQTECSPRATALDPRKILEKIDSVGSPIPNVEVLLLDEDGSEVEQGDVGEVVIQGANVMAGYWRDPAGTREVIDEQGRLHTGDLGRFDDEGDLFLVGRRSAMIKSAGERIFPEELERVLAKHPAIQEAVVVGIEDPLYGQRVVAHVRPSSDGWSGTETELTDAVRKFCLTQIPFARAPREYVCWQDFPRKANGKPDRQAIAESARHG